VGVTLTVKAYLGASKATRVTTATKIRSQDYSQLHAQFNEHLAGVTEIPPREQSENEENSRL
jgi:hypothetical protein